MEREATWSRPAWGAFPPAPVAAGEPGVCPDTRLWLPRGSAGLMNEPVRTLDSQEQNLPPVSARSRTCT